MCVSRKKLYSDHEFNLAPVYKKRKEILNAFDRFRVEILASNVFESWGYKNNYYGGTKYTVEEIIRVCAIPFKVETTEKAMAKFNETAYERERAQFIQMAYNWISDERQEQIENRRPVEWLKPKEDMVVGELYE